MGGRWTKMVEKKKKKKFEVVEQKKNIPTEVVEKKKFEVVEQKKNIPTEVVEMILLNLSVKPLIRFSSVSKAWYSMILGPEFAKRYRGREMMVLRPYYSCVSEKLEALVYPSSSMTSLKPTDKATRFNVPASSYFHASCGVLWCVEYEKHTLGLYNPSTQVYRRLPDPPLLPRVGSGSRVVYGVGYSDYDGDLKVLRINRLSYEHIEVFSAKSDSWITVESEVGNSSTRTYITFLSLKGLFVSGAIHWHVYINFGTRSILSFDLSSYKYECVALPGQVVKYEDSWDLDVCVLMGKLCVYLNEPEPSKLVVWVKERKSWSKQVAISYGHLYPLCYSKLKPLYFDSGNPFKAVVRSAHHLLLFLAEKDQEDHRPAFVPINLGCCILDTFTYLESFVSPFAPST